MGQKRIAIGIDPGWVNLGIAVVEFDDDYKVKVLSEGTFNVSEIGPEHFVAKTIPETILSSVSFKYPIEIAIERYVPYVGVKTSESENITMLIGMLRLMFYLSSPGNNISLYRAIEWKIKLVQLLNKHCGYSNPSSDLDKKFSVSAAKFITNNEHIIQNSHTADAICLAGTALFTNTK